MRTFKSNSGRIRVAALAALVSLSAAASDYAPVEIDGNRLQLQLVEMNNNFYGRITDIENKKPYIIAPKDNISDFIVADGRLYFGAPRTKSSDPMFITRVDGVLNGIDNTMTGKILILNANDASGELGVKNYTYLGTDSHGNRYLSTINEAGGPVLVFPLDISEDGEVTLAGRYELQCDQGKYAAKVYISGDIISGDFEATALLRDEIWPYFNEDNCASHNRWIGHWTVAGSEQTTHFVNELRTTYASISYIPGTDSFLFDDNGRYAEPGKWEFESTSQAGYVTTTPSICHFENEKFIIDSELPGVAEGTFHAGAAVFELAGYNIVVYNTTPGAPTYRIAVLSGSGTSGGATAEVTPLWTLAEEFSEPDNTASAWTNEHNNAHIYAVPSPDGNAADLYIASNQKDMAHYRIACNGSSTSEMPVTATDTGGDPQYYDLAGRTVITPALPGIYLERRGNTVRKLIVR